MAHTAKVGSVEILSLLDVPDWHLPQFFPSAPPDLWETYQSLYPTALCDGTSICISATAYLVRSAGRTMLVDTGLGPGPHQRIGNQRGRLLDDMRGAGVQPEEIDTVIITHLHFDHVGWNAQAGPAGVSPTFPNARYLVPQKDWELYRSPAEAEKRAYLGATVALYQQGRVDLVDGEQTVTPDVTLVPTPGHTPGHQAIMVVSGNERAAIIGDAAHTPAQVQETHWSPNADHDPVLSSQTRSRMFAQYEADHTLLCAGHFPHPGFGYLTRVGNRRLYRALPGS
jgi:glyoxylase-like metal-dependent hydrolase (beta-lactamase superfamily II)